MSGGEGDLAKVFVLISEVTSLALFLHDYKINSFYYIHHNTRLEAL